MVVMALLPMLAMGGHAGTHRRTIKVYGAGAT
jgi:hypothetical protein